MPLHVQALDGDALSRRIHEVVDLIVDANPFVLVRSDFARKLDENLLLIFVPDVHVLARRMHTYDRRLLLERRLITAPADIPQILGSMAPI